MDNFVYEYATKVYFGKGAVKEHLANALKPYKKIMLAYGGGSIKVNGIYEEVMEILKDKEIVEFFGIMPNPTYAKVQEGAALAKQKQVDFILAVGGGSVIDCCKIVAAQAVTDEDIWTMEMEKHQFPKAAIKMGAIVTASGTGAEMNGGSVITHEEKKIKTGIMAAAPHFAILDPEYTLSVPFKQVISGAFDTLSHAMETYFGRSDEENISDDLAEAVMKNTIANIRVLLNDPKNYTARSSLMWDSAMAENGILKLGRKTDFEVHQIEHQLGAYTDCNHGEGLAVLHPFYYKHIYKDAVDKFARFAVNVWKVSKDMSKEEQALEGIEKLAEFIKECGLPVRLKDLHMKKGALELLNDETLRAIAESCTITTGGYGHLTHEEIYEILKECMD